MPQGNITLYAKWTPVIELAYALINNDTEYEVTGIGAVTDVEIIIPSLYRGKSVTSIASRAFYNSSGLTSITIPDSVTSIGSSAFRGCSGLASITLPFVGNTLSGTTNTHFGYIFGAGSYSDNSSRVPISLKSVVITGGSSIGYYAFSGCSGLTSITIPDSVTSIGSSAFEGAAGLQL